MQARKFVLPFLLVFFLVNTAFSQKELLKGVVNNLAYYRQKKDLKYLDNAKKSVDSLIKASAPDTLNLERNVYKEIIYSSILYIDSANKLKEPDNLLQQATVLYDRLQDDRKIYGYQAEMDYSRKCLSNVYIRKAFAFINNSDFINSLPLLELAKKYAPDFRPIDSYIAYANSKLGNLNAAAKYYAGMVGGDSTKAEYAETAASIYKSFGDTVSALGVIKRARKVLPADKSLMLQEANIYNNRHDYHDLSNLLPDLLDINQNNADIAFVAANCYDHLSQYEKAESLYLRSIELNSAAYDPVFNLGLLYFKESMERRLAGDKIENEARAAQWLERASEISPNDANCLQVLQLVYARANNQEQFNKVNNKLKQLTNQ
jgi:tetratricopeptide (TPR) repeat protein